MSTNTAEDEEEKRRIEAEIKNIEYSHQSFVPKSELDKKDELIRKLIEDIEHLCEHPLETWPTNRFNELSEREIQELLRIKNKQS